MAQSYAQLGEENGLPKLDGVVPNNHPLFYTHVWNFDYEVIASIHKQLAKYTMQYPSEDALKDVKQSLTALLYLSDEVQVVKEEVAALERAVVFKNQLNGEQLLDDKALQSIYIGLGSLPENQLKADLKKQIQAILKKRQLNVVEQVNLSDKVPFTFAQNRTGEELLAELNNSLSDDLQQVSMAVKSMVLKQAILDATQYSNFEALVQYMQNKITDMQQALVVINEAKFVQEIEVALHQIELPVYHLQQEVVQQQIIQQLLDTEESFVTIDRLNRFILITILRLRKQNSPKIETNDDAECLVSADPSAEITDTLMVSEKQGDEFFLGYKK
ncbi:hypothetical protein [Sporosarcina sp. FSL K6-3457]|uniref:hypothetical protein n=1 Tax=Sporosarcina sp. FSL K6-3457 TaxID=2978204 RepID=UPI0030F7D03D